MNDLHRMLVFLTGVTVGILNAAEPVALFDGVSFQGWEGDTENVWRIRDGVIVGGSLEGNPQNEFLSTTRSYRNFHLRAEYKLVGTDGFVNGGIQFRSQRIDDPPNEMIGYQADIGAGYSGFLYDESRRRTMLVSADPELIQALERPEEWNVYEIRAMGAEVSLFLNGRRTAVWLERDPEIPLEGHIALQIHGACKAEISFRNLSIEALPDTNVPPPAEVLSRFGERQPRASRPAFPDGRFGLEAGEIIVLVGQENWVREQKGGFLEARLTSGFAQREPRFRSMAWEADTVYEQWRDLNFGAWSEQLQTVGATLVLAQFGQVEALEGRGRLPAFKAAYHRLLDQFAVQTRRHVLVSPMPFEKPLASHAPDLSKRNDEVGAYVATIREIARERGAVFVDLFGPLMARGEVSPRLTEDGMHLTESGLRVIADIIAEQLGAAPVSIPHPDRLLQAIREKNRVWFDCWRPANWSFVYGDRIWSRYGKAAGEAPTLQATFEHRRLVVEAGDSRIHALAKGQWVSLPPLPRQGESEKSPPALSPRAQRETLTVAPGYSMNLFASEHEAVVNPTQFAWDEKGRLYVACSPSYPQTQSGALPADYIVVLEDQDGDGRADRWWKAVENLTMVQGVEPGPDGLYVCDFDRLLYCRDRDGDGKADERQVIFSGFGVGDTHQMINSISHGPDGSLWFTQGLHAMSQVETPWGISRLDRSGVWRFEPRSLRLEGFFGGGMAGANCWGVVFDDFGQVFHKSGDRPHGYWSVPGMVRGGDPLGSGDRHIANVSYQNSPEQYHSVGALFETSPKTTSIDLIGTRALPAALQGLAVIGGYFGAVVELHQLHDQGAGFVSSQLPKLVRSNHDAFRPVDVSVGPDGAIYLADWYNPIIGHYQASYADPRRDKHHGRIWRITAQGFPAVTQPDLAAMDLEELLDQLRSPERWTRYQAKRLLFYAPTEEVVAAADRWAETIDENDLMRDRLLMELMGVYQAHHVVRPQRLRELLKANDFRVRAYGTRVLGHWAGGLEDPIGLLREQARDAHPRVRLEAVVACSYLRDFNAVSAATEVLDMEMDRFLVYALRQTARSLQPHWGPRLSEGTLELSSSRQESYLRDLLGDSDDRVSPGEALYQMACVACHQPSGEGLTGVYPPLAESDWVRGGVDRLIKTVLHGLEGPLRVNGTPFISSAEVPMPGFSALSNEQIAEVLSFVRAAFGNRAGPISPEQVRRVRESTSTRMRPWTEAEL